MVDLVSLAIPVIYLGILVASLATFSSLYRKRQAVHEASLAPWFGPHVQRNMYYTLHALAEESKVPDTIIKAALMRRAAEDVRRILEMRNAKPALGSMLGRGSIGDDLMQRFQRAEKELEAELQDVVAEAEALQKGWGQVIFQSASEIAANNRLRQRVDEIQSQKESDKAWWEKKRATTREEFLKELDQDDSTKDDDSRVPSVAPSSVAGDKAGSDEDGVLVEAGPTADSTETGSPVTPGTPGTPGTQGGKKNKKKSKK